MLSSPSKRSSRLLQFWIRSPCAAVTRYSFATVSKEERQKKLAEKYKPNTKLPGTIGQLSNISTDQLFYIPKISQQLSPELYASHQKSENDDISNVCIYEYKKKIIRNKPEMVQSLQLFTFAAATLGFPLVLMGTMYSFPEWSKKMIAGMTFDWFFYWTQAGFMAFLVGAFVAGFRQQLGSLLTIAKTKLYGTKSYISKICIVHPQTNELFLNIEYFQNTLFHKKALYHNIPLLNKSILENQQMYLKPVIDANSKSADISCVIDLPDRKGNIIPIELPKDGSIKNWESFITLIKDIPNPSGKFTPVSVDENGFIAVAKYQDLLSSPRTTLDVYSHGIPPYRKKNTYLFVPNVAKTKLFVLYEQCKTKRRSLVNQGSFYEENGETYLHCSGCQHIRTRMNKPLESSVEWKLKYNEEDSDDVKEDNAMVWIKLDASIIKNPLEFVDAFGHCALETFLGFYCTNSFRLAHPKKPESIKDIFVLGELTQYGGWKEDISPSIQPLAQ